MVRNLHAFMLQSGGFEVSLAENGSEALEKLLLDAYDLVVTDINMPQMDGYELVRSIRSMAPYRQTPIIIVSTESEAADKARGFEAGANVYVVKPTTADDLVLNAEMLLGARQAKNARAELLDGTAALEGTLS
jgi:two-component system chemotaxis response regulator CheY